MEKESYADKEKRKESQMLRALAILAASYASGPDEPCEYTIKTANRFMKYIEEGT